MATSKDSKDLDRVAGTFHTALTSLIRACRFRDQEAIGPMAVSASQSHALERLATQGPLTLNAFAAMVFLERSSASRLVERLVAKGLIHKAPHPADARSVILTLTSQGKKLQRRLERELIEERKSLLRSLSPEQQHAVVDAVSKLARIATAKMPEPRT